jgi:hypothetical protein
MGVFVRCDACGAMRWSIRAKSADVGTPDACEICGGSQRVERRRPGRRFSGPGRERRDFRAPAKIVPPA